jgi:hypothetical protein
MTEHLPECHQTKYLNQVMWGSISRDEPFVPCICDALRACEARVIGAAVQRVEAIPDDPDSGVDWNWDYDIDPTGMTRNPYVWIREAVAAIKKGEQ